MAGKGSRPGEHRGGRKKGTPNKGTVDIQERLARLKCDPIEGMAKIAANPKITPELRGRMYAELAQYVAPKLRASEQIVEITHTYVARTPQRLPEVEWQQQHADPLKNHPIINSQTLQ